MAGQKGNPWGPAMSMIQMGPLSPGNIRAPGAIRLPTDDALWATGAMALAGKAYDGLNLKNIVDKSISTALPGGKAGYFEDWGMPNKVRGNYWGEGDSSTTGASDMDIQDQKAKGYRIIKDMIDGGAPQDVIDEAKKRLNLTKAPVAEGPTYANLGSPQAANIALASAVPAKKQFMLKKLATTTSREEKEAIEQWLRMNA